MKWGDHLQTKKLDLEVEILNCARNEFMRRGYENASLRTIAKKANTSLGNIYHYFPNKKAILDELLTPAVDVLDQFIRFHTQQSQAITDLDEINSILEEVDFDDDPFRSILSKEFVIFIETKDPEYSMRRDELMKLFHDHIAWHMHVNDPNNHFAVIFSKMIIDCVIHMVKCNTCVKNRKQDFIDIFNMLCRCVTINDLSKK